MHLIITKNVEIVSLGMFSEVTDVTTNFGTVYFKMKTGVKVQAHGSYIIYTTKSLSCGHALENYYEDDAGNAGVWPHCKQCENVL